jgi:hypothetical protein
MGIREQCLARAGYFGELLATVQMLENGETLSIEHLTELLASAESLGEEEFAGFLRKLLAQRNS